MDSLINFLVKIEFKTIQTLLSREQLNTVILINAAAAVTTTSSRVHHE